MASANSGPLIPRRRLGAAFRELRDARGETLQQTAKALMFSPSKLSRIENGLAGEPHPRDVRDLVAHFGLNGVAARRLEELAEAGRQPGWWQLPPYRVTSDLDTFISYESAATRVEHYSPTVIPGLLQIEDYAQDTIARLVPHLTQAEVDHQVEIRMERQRQLRLRDQPLSQWYVVPETVLHRKVGTSETMRSQLATLLQASEDPLIEFYVIPFSAGLYEATELSPIHILRFSPTDSDIVVIERSRHVDFLDRPNTVKKYSDIFSRLPNYWLDRDRSREYLATILREKWQEAP